MLKITWKDPDHYVQGAGVDDTNSSLDDALRDRLFEMGVREYMTIEADTDTGELKVVLPKKRGV